MTRTSKAIPKAEHRTYAAKDFKMTKLPVDTHVWRNQSHYKKLYSGTWETLKLYRGTNPSSMSKKGKYYFYDSNGTTYYETNDKNDWRKIQIHRK